jgi:signal transduction histidine kinase
MMSPATATFANAYTSASPAEAQSVADRAADLLRQHQQAIWRRTDRLFAGLLFAQWIGGIVLALWRSPRTWVGGTSSIHPHVWAAVVLGGLIISLPIALVMLRPGSTLTRHVIAVSQLLFSGLLIHLGDGRIEMHFHVFGSLAFLAFYRDWRVLVTASLVTAIDHIVRGLYLPESIYGVLEPTLWRSLEHAAWVVFEDVFLITSCVQGVREMRGIAENRALLEHSYSDVEAKVHERTRELKAAQTELVKSARSAGMAEIATSVLHNVGNVLNSVNVSATVVSEKLRNSEVASLAQVGEIFREHKPDLANFLTDDDRGKMIPDFITELAACLGDENQAMLKEISSLATGIDHIKQIVAAQQSLGKKSVMNMATDPVQVMETALMMQNGLQKHPIKIVREFTQIPPVQLDQHKVLQVLINLISNAAHALYPCKRNDKQLTIGVALIEKSEGASIRFTVADNGTGIAPENKMRIFTHGFTTKNDGHGFGLHSCANAAGEMGGTLSAHSDGPDLGAVFTLEIPIETIKAGEACTL